MGKATRDAYGEVLKELGGENPDIVVLDAIYPHQQKHRYLLKPTLIVFSIPVLPKQQMV